MDNPFKKMKNLRLHDVSIHRNFHHNWSINKFLRMKKNQLSESRKPGVFLCDIEKLKFLIIVRKKETMIALLIHFILHIIPQGIDIIRIHIFWYRDILQE